MMPFFKESITKEEMAELPLQVFEGEIVLVETPAAAREAAKFLNNFPVVGFDTETKPAFKKGENHKVALLQLSTNDKAFIFRVKKTGIPDVLGNFLENKEIHKPGVAIRDDLKALQGLRPFRPSGFIELQDFARQRGIQHFSLKKLAAIVLGFRISKSQQLSNWDADELTPPQLVYAATDAWVSLKIYEKFIDGN